MHTVLIVADALLAAQWAMLHLGGRWVLVIRGSCDTAQNRADAWTWAAAHEPLVELEELTSA